MRAQTASLRLWQTEARQQPNRVWTFLDPTILVRDLRGALGALDERARRLGHGRPGPGRVAGLRQLRRRRDRPAADRRRRARRSTPALRARARTSTGLDLGAVPDGVQTLRLEVDGDGTARRAAPGGDPSDRPHAPGRPRVTLLGLPDDAVRATVSVERRDERGARLDAARPQRRRPDGGLLDHRRRPRPTSTSRPTPRRARRSASSSRRATTPGSRAQVTSAPVTRPAPRLERARRRRSSEATGRSVSPGGSRRAALRCRTSPASRRAGIRANQARSYSRNGPPARSADRIDLLAAGDDLGSIPSPERARPAGRDGLPGRPEGLHRARRRSPIVAGASPSTCARAGAGPGARSRSGARWWSPRRDSASPAGHDAISARSIRPGETLRISGVISPRGAGRGKLVKLEWRLRGTWRPLALATADRRGRFVLRYRFSAGASAFTIPLRVVVPRERGWRYLPVVARRFVVHVG